MVAWVFYHNKMNTTFGNGKLITPGYLDDQCAYQSELYGIYGIESTIWELSTYQDFTGGSITIACNGESALHRCFKPWNSNPLAKHFDLIQATWDSNSNCTIGMVLGACLGPPGQHKWHPHSYQATQCRNRCGCKWTLGPTSHTMTWSTHTVPWRRLENFPGPQENKYKPEIPPVRPHGWESSQGVLGQEDMFPWHRCQPSGLEYNWKSSSKPNDQYVQMDH